MVVRSNGYGPVEGGVSKGQVHGVSYCQVGLKVKFGSILLCHFEHFYGEVDAVEVEAALEGEEVGAVGTANVQQFPLLPSERQFTEFAGEARPVPDLVPAFGDLVEDFLV